MQPGEPVRAGDGEDATVAEVDDRRARVEGPRLRGRLAVMPGHPGVRAGGLDRTRALQERGAPYRLVGRGDEQAWRGVRHTVVKAQRAQKIPGTLTRPA